MSKRLPEGHRTVREPHTRRTNAKGIETCKPPRAPRRVFSIVRPAAHRQAFVPIVHGGAVPLHKMCRKFQMRGGKNSLASYGHRGMSENEVAQTPESGRTNELSSGT